MPVETKNGAHWLAPSITAHAWNADRTKLAICPNTSEVWIYSGCGASDASAWTREHVLTEHDMSVSGIDWCPITDKIVTCSHDRNAFVWTYSPEEGKWKPSIVILRIERAALKAQWSPDGRKFAVGSGAKCVPVCHFEEEHDWWVSDQIKKHKSTVLSVAWHPNSQLLATASTDFKCRIFNAYIEGVDAGPDPGPFAAVSDVFGDLYMELDMSKGWVEDVAWGPSGNTLAFVGHDASVTLVALAADPADSAVQVLRTRGLPFSFVSFVSDTSLVAAGHDFNPGFFAADAAGNWGFVDTLDKKSNDSKETTTSSSFGAARAMFAAKASKGSAGAKKASVWTKHQGAITGLEVHSAPGAPVSAVSTTGLDGRLVVWDLATLGMV